MEVFVLVQTLALAPLVGMVTTAPCLYAVVVVARINCVLHQTPVRVHPVSQGLTAWRQPVYKIVNMVVFAQRLILAPVLMVGGMRIAPLLFAHRHAGMEQTARRLTNVVVHLTGPE